MGKHLQATWNSFAGESPRWRWNILGEGVGCVCGPIKGNPLLGCRLRSWVQTAAAWKVEGQLHTLCPGCTHLHKDTSMSVKVKASAAIKAHHYITLHFALPLTMHCLTLRGRFRQEETLSGGSPTRSQQQKWALIGHTLWQNSRNVFERCLLMHLALYCPLTEKRWTKESSQRRRWEQR